VHVPPPTRPRIWLAGAARGGRDRQLVPPGRRAVSCRTAPAEAAAHRLV